MLIALLVVSTTSGGLIRNAISVPEEATAPSTLLPFDGIEFRHELGTMDALEVQTGGGKGTAENGGHLARLERIDGPEPILVEKLELSNKSLRPKAGRIRLDLSELDLSELDLIPGARYHRRWEERLSGIGARRHAWSVCKLRDDAYLQDILATARTRLCAPGGIGPPQGG